MQIDLRSDAYKIANEELKKLNYHYEKIPQADKDLASILPTYFNTLARLPAQIKWQIKKSNRSYCY